MKKTVSFFLVLSLLMSSCGAALADVLKLPSKLEIIEEYAFFGDKALDTVELPYGATRIESQAFAQSGVSRITLPDTISYIAQNAFDGTNVRIRASEGSYAHSWALSNGFEMDKGMNHEEAKQTLAELNDDPFTDEELLSETSELEEINAEDPEEILEAFAELNALIENENILAEQSNAEVESLKRSVDDLVQCTSSMTQVNTGSYTKITFDSLSLTMDQSIANQENVSIREASTSEDGTVTTLKVSNGETWYMYENSGNYYLSLNKPSPGSQLRITSRGVVGDFIQRAEEVLNRINQAYGFVSGKIDNLIEMTNKSIEKGEATNRWRRSLIQKLQDRGAKSNRDYFDQYDVERAAKLEREIELYENKIVKLRLKAGRLTSLAKAFSGLNIVGVGLSVGTMVAYWLEMNEIDDHGHPNANDNNQEMLKIANSMNRSIRELRTYLVTNFILTMSQLLLDIVVFASVVPTAGASLAPGIILNAIFIGIDMLMGNHMDGLVEKIRDDHVKLHNSASIYGTVYDEKKHQPLEGVTVSAGNYSVQTDANGGYEIIFDEAVTYLVTADKDGYKAETEVVALNENDRMELDFSLNKQYIIRTREDLENVVDAPDEDYVLANTIDLSGVPWTPNTGFNGTLDGDGYSIIGMQIIDVGNGNIGLFNEIDGAIISNLALYGSIHVPIATEYENIGGFGGTIQNSSIKKCTVNLSVSASEGNGQVFIGGFGGCFVDSEMLECKANTNISVRSNQNVFAGGLVGNVDGTCRAVNADANVYMDIKQTGYNPSGGFYAYGTFYFRENEARRCDASGTIRVQTTDGKAQALGIANSIGGTNDVNITVKTGSGRAEAFGCLSGDQNTNRGAIQAFAENGEAMAKGVSIAGHDARNEGMVHVETRDGIANAYGIWDETENQKSFDGVNLGEITALSFNSTANATGIYGCVYPVNEAKVRADADSGRCYAIGLDSSDHGENMGEVTANSNYSSDACGLSNCKASINRGNVKSISAAANDNGRAYAAGAQDGRYNVNRSSVEARCTGGYAYANGTQCDDSQNYGNVMARGHSAFGTGCGGHSGCLNEGPVSSFANGGSVVAHGVNGAGSVSTALVSATQLESVNQSNYSRLSSTDLYASGSTQCQVTINGRTALSTGSKKTGFSYNYKTGAISTWDAITNWDHWVGLCSAESVVYGYEYVWPEVPAAPVRN